MFRQVRIDLVCAIFNVWMIDHLKSQSYTIFAWIAVAGVKQNPNYLSRPVKSECGGRALEHILVGIRNIPSYFTSNIIILNRCLTWSLFHAYCLSCLRYTCPVPLHA